MRSKLRHTRRLENLRSVRPAKARMVNLTGRFTLDKDRSESLYPHMKALGCDEIAALASEKLNITVDIVQTATSLTIFQSSQLGDTKRTLNLDGTTTETSTRTAKVTNDDRLLVIETTFPKGRIVDRRSMDGEDMAQVLELTIKGADHVIRTRRLFRKLGPPDPSVTGT